jgi:hypothetical protein
VASKPHRLSLFAQPLDRAAFVAYLLGAVVPLAVLGWVVHRFVRPAWADDTGRLVLLAVLGFLGLLSLASFLALRKTAHAAVARLDRDNRRLLQLLDASRDLAIAGDEAEIFRLTQDAAALVAHARSGHVVVRTKGGELSPARGDASAPAAARETLAAAAEAALDALRPTLRGAEDATGGLAVAVPFGAGERRSGALAVWHDAAHPYDASELPALSTLAAFATVALRNDDLREAERNFFVHSTSLLVSTLDRYLANRSDHSRRTAALANRLGRRLGLSEPRLERLHFASLLHDIGMLRIARDNVADREEYVRHPALGAEMLAPIRLWEDLAPFVRHHQEFWDGQGYPDGIAGEAIPLESRIIGVAEAFDTMTALRSYKRPVSVDEALLRLKAAAGAQFDPQVVDALLALHAEDALG